MSKQHTLHEYSTQEAKNLKLGQGGYVVLKNTTSAGYVHSDLGHYIAFTVLTDNSTVVSSQLHSPEIDWAVITADYPKGITVHGAWERISIQKISSSGDDLQIILYKG